METEICAKQQTNWAIMALTEAMHMRLPKTVSLLVLRTQFCFCVHGDNHLKVIKKDPVTNSTAQRRIESMGCGVKCGLFKQVRVDQGFAMAADEFTDLASLFCL
jgi:hypothetical protein